MLEILRLPPRILIFNFTMGFSYYEIFHILNHFLNNNNLIQHIRKEKGKGKKIWELKRKQKELFFSSF
jgi:hypothetical protein